MTRSPRIITRLALDAMSEFIVSHPRAKFYAYENHDLGHIDCGHLKFLACGEDCTLKTPPDKLPDTTTAINWRYLLIGTVNLHTGEIENL